MSAIVPYWQSDDGALTVYWAPYEDVLAAGLVPLRHVKLIHDDPPYGIGHDTRLRNRNAPLKRLNGGIARPRAKDFPPIVGDDRPHDPSAVLALARPTVSWGANYYASRLPDSGAWLYWDKRDGVGSNDGADGELAWTNLGGAARVFRHVWSGLCRGSESGGTGGSVAHLHPTQKPIALCSWVYQRAKLKRGDLVFVPHMGSGPDLPACAAMGLRLIACDVEEWCCRTAVARMKAAPHPEPVAALGPLFAPRPA